MGRTVRKLHRAERDDIADLQTRRPLPGREIDMLDPFQIFQAIRDYQLGAFGPPTQ